MGSSGGVEKTSGESSSRAPSGDARRSHLDVAFQRGVHNDSRATAARERREKDKEPPTLEVNGFRRLSTVNATAAEARKTAPSSTVEAPPGEQGNRTVRRGTGDGRGFASTSTTASATASAFASVSGERRASRTNDDRNRNHRRNSQPAGYADPDVDADPDPDADDEHVRDLVRAVHANDAEKLRRLLDGPRDGGAAAAALNVRHPETRRSALHEAVAAMRRDMVALLLRHGADPNVPHDSQGRARAGGGGEGRGG